MRQFQSDKKTVFVLGCSPSLSVDAAGVISRPSELSNNTNRSHGPLRHLLLHYHKMSEVFHFRIETSFCGSEARNVLTGRDSDLYCSKARSALKLHLQHQHSHSCRFYDVFIMVRFLVLNSWT